MQPVLRTIKVSDNIRLAEIIRQSLLEFNAAKPGTVYYDPTTDHLTKLFTKAASRFYVLEIEGILVGGAGIYPTDNLPSGTCELVKFYIDSSARGKGYGKLLLHACETAARELGYSTIYLESMPELNIALPLYEKMGYKYIPAALGNSGHTGCTVFMIKELSLPA
ncbi:MAG: GNAT family N-acetyltransferase [Ferruginibacter sp.]